MPAVIATGTNAIVEISLQCLSTDLPRDIVTNNLAYNTNASGLTTANWQSLTDTILGIWKLSPGAHWGYSGCKITVNAYDLADAKPRPEKGHSVYTPTTWNTDTIQARQTALCVSFYCDRNLKRQRGRVYLIPLNNAGASEHPTGTVIDGAMALLTATNSAVTALSPSWQQCVHSERDANFKYVTNWWVDNSWDVQRRRQPKATLRHTSP